jgi:alpha-glucosidase
MLDVDVPPEERQDPQGLRGGVSRDPGRTPMRWNASAGAGFTSGQPWLPVGPQVDEINVARQREQAGSMLSLHRRLLELRRREAALHAGQWHDLGAAGSVLAYLRTDGARRVLVALNLRSRPAGLPPAARELIGRIQAATDHRRDGEPFDGHDGLASDEGLVVLLD